MLDYILVMAGGALGTGARFWVSGFVAERGGELVPLGTLLVNVTGSFARVLCRFHRPGRVLSYLTAASPILHDRRVWRLHNVFVLQLANTRSRSRWRLVQSRPEYTALICLLSCCRLAWTHSCSRNIAEIKTTYAPS